MKKILFSVFVALTFTFMSCGDDDYAIDEAYEKAEITNITLYGRGEAVMSDKMQIDSEAGTIAVTLKANADIKDLKMIATISAGATITPGMAIGFQDYSAPRAFTVTSPGGSVVKQWTVTVASAVQ